LIERNGSVETTGQGVGKVYRYENNAFFSIDGERYPAQKI
jgi:hypothetical protein